LLNRLLSSLMLHAPSARAGTIFRFHRFTETFQGGDTMPDYDPKTDIHVTSGPPSGGGGLYFIVGALVVAVLVGAYFMFGAPGLHSNVARAPERNVNVTVEQPRTPAQPAPASPAPAPQRQQ
jgi:hypothetical protein